MFKTWCFKWRKRSQNAPETIRNFLDDLNKTGGLLVEAKWVHYPNSENLMEQSNNLRGLKRFPSKSKLEFQGKNLFDKLVND